MVVEGVHRFQIAHREAHLAGERFSSAVETLDAWRSVLRRLGWVGRDPGRYDGYGFGNLSVRLPPFDAPTGQRSFVVSASQTGERSRLGGAGCAIVESYDAEANRVVSCGAALPSSESLTHGALYDLDPEWRAVVHVHSAELWHAAAREGLPATGETAEAGTDEIARGIAQWAGSPTLRELRILWMPGHQDGLLSVGHTLGEAVAPLLELWGRCGEP